MRSHSPLGWPRAASEFVLNAPCAATCHSVMRCGTAKRFICAGISELIRKRGAHLPRLVKKGVKRTLESAGLTMDDLLSVQIFCSDVSLFEAFNAVYRTYFKNEFPVRAFLGSGKLLFDARFEVQG